MLVPLLVSAAPPPPDGAAPRGRPPQTAGVPSLPAPWGSGRLVSYSVVENPVDGSVTPAVGMSRGTGRRGPGAHGSCRVWPRELFLGNLKCAAVSPRGPSSGVQRVPWPPEGGPCCSPLYVRILCEIRWKNKKDSAIFKKAWGPSRQKTLKCDVAGGPDSLTSTS